MRILIVDDHPLAREALKVLLNRVDDLELVAEARDGQEAITLAKQFTPDVVLMDIGLPDMDGLQATRQICKAQPGARVLILTQYMDEFLVRTAIRRGAKGFVFKTEMASELVPALRALFGGNEYYSSSISRLLGDDNGNKVGGDHSDRDFVS